MRRVLQENEANYCKDRFQKRMLAALSGGLLTAEDAHWYSQRRLIAPLPIQLDQGQGAGNDGRDR